MILRDPRHSDEAIEQGEILTLLQPQDILWETMAGLIVLLLLVVGAPFAQAGKLEEELLALEKKSWNAWGNADGEFFTEVLTEDATQIVAGTGMVVGRESIVEGVSAGGCELTSYDFTNVTVRQPVKDIAIISYTATQDTSCGGTKLPAKVQSTNVYVRQKGQWRSVSYQETPID